MIEHTNDAYIRIYDRDGFIMAMQLPMKPNEVVARLLDGDVSNIGTFKRKLHTTIEVEPNE